MLSALSSRLSAKSEDVTNSHVDINSYVTQLTELNSGKLASASEDGILRLWNVVNDSMTCVASFYSPHGTHNTARILCLEALASGTLVVGYSNGNAEFWSTSGKKPLFMLQLNNLDNLGFGKLVTMTVLSGKYLVCGFSEGEVHAWNMSQLNLAKLTYNKTSISQLKLENSYAISSQFNEEALPLSLLSAQEGMLISLHCSRPGLELESTIDLPEGSLVSTVRNTKGYIKIWQAHSIIERITKTVIKTVGESDPIESIEVVSETEIEELVQLDSINYPAYFSQTLALILLPNNLIVTAKNTRTGTELSVLQLVKTERSSDQPRRYALLPLPLKKPISIEDDGISYLLNSPSEQNKFISITSSGIAQFWEIINADGVVTLNQLENSYDLGEPTRCRPVLLSNGCLVSNQGCNLRSQKTSFYVRPARTLLRFNTEAVVPESFPEIKHNDLNDKQMIGKGAFGSAYSAMCSNGIKVALKQAIRENDQAMLLSEIKLHNQLSHDNVVAMYGYSQDERKNIFLVMEFITGGDLFNLLQNSAGTISMRERLEIGLDIARAFLYLHTLFIIHRDIKPENIFLDDKGRAKIGDFGMATKISKFDSSLVTGQLQGSPRYLAPEAWREGRYSKASDCFGFAVFLWELFTHMKTDYISSLGINSHDIQDKGLRTKIRMTGLEKAIRAGTRAKFPNTPQSADTPPRAIELMESMWNQNYQKRCDIQTAVDVLSDSVQRLNSTSR